jgi:hypothetical protein
LMKRIGDEEAEMEQTKVALEDIRASRYGSCDPFNAGKPTIRAVSNTTVGTCIDTGQENDDDAGNSHQLAQSSRLTPVIYNDNVERRKVKLASLEEKSSFFPFSDQRKPQTPSPFRKLLELRRSEGKGEVTFDDRNVEEDTCFGSEPPRLLEAGINNPSCESIYSGTTDGAMIAQDATHLRSSNGTGGVSQRVDEDAGMATIIPTKYRPADRPKLPSADSNEKRAWQSWMAQEVDSSLGRRDSSRNGIHYREHAQIDSDDVQVQTGRTSHDDCQSGLESRFPLLHLKEVPRNHTPVPSRSSSLTKSQSGLLKRASTLGLSSSCDRNGENRKLNINIRKLSPGNLTNMLREKRSQISSSRADNFDKENKPIPTNDSPRSSSPPMSTPGRFGLQMRSANGKLRKRASDVAVRTGQENQLTPKNISAPLKLDASECDESPTDRVKQSLSARLSRPFNMDVPESNRPFDSMFLGKQGINPGAERLSTAPVGAMKRSKGYGGLGHNPFDSDKENTALPKIQTPDGGIAPSLTASDKGKAGWSSKRMVSDFLKKRRLGRSSSSEEGKVEEKEENQSPAFV